MRLRIGGDALDIPMALLLGGAALFFAAAMPAPLFGGLVERSGLGLFVPGAQPPFGTTARLLAACGAGIVAFLAGWLVMHLAGKLDRQPGRAERAIAYEFQHPPVIRRADAHPDAPARHPLRAVRDLGEPSLPPLDEEETHEAELLLGDKGDEDMPPTPFDSSAPDGPEAAEPKAARQAQASGRGFPVLDAPHDDAEEGEEAEEAEEAAASSAPAPGGQGASTAELIGRFEAGVRRRGGRPKTGPGLGEGGVHQRLKSAIAELRAMSEEER
ncbi:MAG: hypothetical protein ACFBQW_02075 [Sphingomonadaceae bacterium]